MTKITHKIAIADATTIATTIVILTTAVVVAIATPTMTVLELEELLLAVIYEEIFIGFDGRLYPKELMPITLNSNAAPDYKVKFVLYDYVVTLYASVTKELPPVP